MADLKTDLLQSITNDLMYDEMELVRLANDPNTIYRDKIKNMSSILASIALIQAKIQLVQKYFTEPVAAPQPNVPQPQQNVAPQQQVSTPIPGQSHGE
jgi:hypothetical protein